MAHWSISGFRYHEAGFCPSPRSADGAESDLLSVETSVRSGGRGAYASLAAVAAVFGVSTASPHSSTQRCGVVTISAVPDTTVDAWLPARPWLVIVVVVVWGSTNCTAPTRMSSQHLSHHGILAIKAY